MEAEISGLQQSHITELSLPLPHRLSFALSCQTQKIWETLDEELVRLAYLGKAKRGSQFSSALLVHSLGRVLVRRETFRGPVVSVSTIQVESSVSCPLLCRKP